MMNKELAQYIIARLIDHANDSIAESKEHPGDDLYWGHKLAYYQILNTIQNELDAHDENLEEYGLNINLEKVFYSV